MLLSLFCLQLVIAGTLCGINTAWYVNAQDFQKLCEVPKVCFNNLILYNTKPYEGSNYSNPTEAQDLIDALAVSCDSECASLGSRWTTIYIFCGVSCCLIVANSIM